MKTRLLHGYTIYYAPTRDEVRDHFYRTQGTKRLGIGMDKGSVLCGGVACGICPVATKLLRPFDQSCNEILRAFLQRPTHIYTRGTTCSTSSTCSTALSANDHHGTASSN